MLSVTTSLTDASVVSTGAIVSSVGVGILSVPFSVEVVSGADGVLPELEVSFEEVVVESRGATTTAFVGTTEPELSTEVVELSVVVAAKIAIILFFLMTVPSGKETSSQSRASYKLTFCVFVVV